MFRRSRVSLAAALAVGGVSVLATSGAFAQDAQRVEVTGSSIRRTDAETASPVQIITKQDIEQAGKGTVAEYLQTLTADGQGSVPFTYGRGFSGATSAGVSLRGLGSNATLVLINGRRVTSAVLADDAQRTYVDLNQLPLEAVERIEVLKDGASAIYGSDAVAGVVNVILKKNFVGTTIKATYGVSQEGDGKEPRVALTHGGGDLSKDGYNYLFNIEYGKKDAIYYRDRMGRGSVGVSAIGQPQWGFDPNSGPLNNIGRAGGDGWINDPRSANAVDARSIIGNVRNPADDLYYSRGDAAGGGFTRFFPGAQAFCLANTNLPQNNATGGCITDLRQALNQIQPEHETGSLFGRFTKSITADTEAFVEVSYYTSKSLVTQLPNAFSAGVFQLDGTVLSQAGVSLGAAHPDNPYFGQEARLRYNGLETPVAVDSKSHSTRFAGGVKGTLATWDFDTALIFSEVKQTDTQLNAVNWRVKNALLNPTPANVAAATAFSPAYAALPAGTFYRLGENAGLNSAAVYDALLDDKQRKGFSRQYGGDLKVSNSFGQLSGGPIGVALGVEARHESNNLPLYDGLGDFAGLSLTAYGGERDIFATYGEVLLPVFKQLEINAALRYDDYSDAGRQTTPKVGVKWRPIEPLALRGTYARGFRAPSSTENSPSSLAAFGGAVIDDNARCAALTAAGTLTQAQIDAACLGIAPTFIQRGNPDLKPEKSESSTVGLVWDITPKTSLTADLWQIKRKGLPVIEDPQSAIDAGRLTRDPTTSLAPGDPGPILSASVVFQNSDESLTRGFDLEVRHRMDLAAGMGRVTVGGTWTHLITQRVITSSGTVHDYAGTHGDCNITNCIGSPKDRVSLAATWDVGQWRLGANVNYRGPMSNKFEQSDTTCAQTLQNGEDFPSGCKVKSFTTVDISGAIKIGKSTEIFGSIANVFDKVPPPDFETYGAIGYNPLDYSGAIGRFFRIGVKHQF
jgi:iron complex outermembrane recepter protein